MDRLIYTFPLHMAAKFNTPMLCYGENVSFEYGGCSDKETYSAMDQIENGVAVGFPMEELVGDGVTENDLSLTLAPSAEERAKLDPFYMSYFVPWNSYKNYQIAKEHGFHDLTHEWDRTHHAENLTRSIPAPTWCTPGSSTPSSAMPLQPTIPPAISAMA